MIAIPKWREYSNPLAGLTVARLNAIHSLADRGQHAASQWLYRFAAQADVTLQAAIARRLAFVDQLTWQILTPEGEDEALAQEQAAALRAAYDQIDNLRDATRHLAGALFHGFAILDKNPADALTPATLDPIPGWFWIHPAGREWELNPETIDHLERGEPVPRRAGADVVAAADERRVGEEAVHVRRCRPLARMEHDHGRVPGEERSARRDFVFQKLCTNFT